jgi:hypothetical protein
MYFDGGVINAYNILVIKPEGTVRKALALMGG